eukprot:10610191-Alexandrium_andersonii.AAC.1
MQLKLRTLEAVLCFRAAVPGRFRRFEHSRLEATLPPLVEVEKLRGAENMHSGLRTNTRAVGPLARAIHPHRTCAKHSLQMWSPA